MTMTRLRDLKNIGPRTESWLHAIEVHSLDDLERLGAVEVYRRLREHFPNRVSLNALYALQGAILNLHWNALPPDMKAELRQQAEDLSPP
jgi:DNA transformation protein